MPRYPSSLLDKSTIVARNIDNSQYDNIKIVVENIKHVNTLGSILLADPDIANNLPIITTSLNLTRADKYLASQDIASMSYSSSGMLTKIQYNNPSDVDYEVLSYSSGALTNIAHYVNTVLKGNTVLSYIDGSLSSVVFMEV